MSKFLKVINNFLIEQDEENEKELPPLPGEKITPMVVDDEIPSKLPDEKEVALDIVKYKTLLKALREALYSASSTNLEKQREISNIDVDTDDLKTLKKVEDQLMSILNQSESVPATQE